MLSLIGVTRALNEERHSCIIALFFFLNDVMTSNNYLSKYWHGVGESYVDLSTTIYFIKLSL